MNEAHLAVGIIVLIFALPFIAAFMGIKDERPKSKKGRLPLPPGVSIHDPYYNGR